MPHRLFPKAGPHLSDRCSSWLFDRAAQAGRVPKRVMVDGIDTEARLDEVAARHGLDVQVSTAQPETEGFEPRPCICAGPSTFDRLRVRAIFGTSTTRDRRRTRRWEQSPAAVEDAIGIADGHRLLCAYHRIQDCPVESNGLSGR